MGFSALRSENLIDSKWVDGLIKKASCVFLEKNQKENSNLYYQFAPANPVMIRVNLDIYTECRKRKWNYLFLLRKNLFTKVNQVHTYVLVIDYHGNLVSHLQFRGEWKVLWSIREALLIHYKSVVPVFLRSTRSFAAS